MRARHPDVEGFVDCDGVRIGYEVFGDGHPTILLLPTWTIVHTRFWKMQVPYLARHYRVVTFDGPGNGRSDRPLDPGAYALGTIAADAVAVLDATGSDRAVVLSLSQAAGYSLRLAADRPDRVLGQVFMAPSLPLTPQAPDRARIATTFHQMLDHPQGWEKYNTRYWTAEYPGFLEFFFAQCLTEPHSTKQVEDSIGWGLETTPEVLIAEAESKFVNRDAVLALCRRVTGPTLVIHGSDDQVSPASRGEALATATGGELVTIEGGGHFPMARDPVKVNLAVRDFVDRIARRAAV